MASKIRKGDEVLVITGKDKGKRGKVLRVIRKENRVVVEGVNIIKKHVKPRGMGQTGGIIQQEAPIHISNVMLICTKCGKPTRVGFRILEDKTKVRICKKCKEVID